MRLVYSSAPADESLRAQLASHLHPFVQKEGISEWYEQLIPPGADIAQARRVAWRSADALILLLSADYFLSEACASAEIQYALERRERGQILIIPVLLRPCDWQSTFVADLQCLPRDGQAISTQENQEAALFAVAQEIRRQLGALKLSTSPRSPLQRTNRQRLLKKVRASWIEGLLEPSLRQTTWVDLHLQSQPGAVENPWRLMVQELARKPEPLPPGTSIIQVFDQADEELLILGEPGSGKTTLLLYLARTLLDRAEADESRRAPVVFNLSSWAQQRLPLEQWLVEELKIRYQIPPSIGQAWVEADQIFPLLDGLDEVSESARTACVQAIVAYAQRASAHTPLVVCCRSEEYQKLAVQLPLQYAVMLLPFTDDQIETYLSSVSGPLDELRRVLREDRELFALAHRPLMLSIFTQAYQGADSDDLPAATRQEDYPQAIFRYYVKHMLTRRARWPQGSEEEIYRWLSYLARQLHLQQQTIFTVEYLQPVWLPERYRNWYRWSLPLVYALTFGLCFGPIFALAFSFVYWLLRGQFLFGLGLGLILGIAGGLTGGLVFGLTFRQQQTIQPAEASAWSWSAAGRGALLGLAGGAAVGLLAGGIAGMLVSPAGGIVVGLAVTLVVGFAGGLVGGPSPLQLPERSVLSPNEGIWRSGRRGVLLVLCAILVFGLGAGTVFGLFSRSITDFLYAWIYGPLLGVGAGLIFGLAFGLVGGRTGLAAFLQHFTLRLFLARLKLLPWKLIPFLDEATDRLLLHRVGGSYLFVHRLLRDVLATQEESERSDFPRTRVG
jgi:DNA polymerase III delta prime subunit/MFS family permease